MSESEDPVVSAIILNTLAKPKEKALPTKFLERIIFLALSIDSGSRPNPGIKKDKADNIPTIISEKRTNNRLNLIFLALLATFN